MDSINRYYVVIEGRMKGIFLSWEDCNKMVEGYPNAEYKAFKNPYEAVEFLLKFNSNDINENTSINQHIDKNIQKEQYFGTIEAYVDGSYDSEAKAYGSGILILKDGEIIESISRKGDNPEVVDMRNVAGEIAGAMLAMKYCYDNNYENLIIYYDYSGIEKWCTGEWKTKKIGTMKYKNYYDKISARVSVKFSKVKAHSGNKYNDIADELARKSIEK